MWKKRNIILAFLLPFIIGGILYSYLALSYLNSLPPSMKQPLDLSYAVYVSFIDMGTTFGIAGITLLSVVSKLNLLLKRYKHSES